MSLAAGPADEPAVTLAHTVYFLRHGETDWNLERRLQGQTDRPLNETGRVQIARHARVMAGLGEDWSGFDFAVSPLSRCRETFEILKDGLGIEADPIVDMRLAEGAFGRWEGWTWQEILSREPENHDIWLEHCWTTAPHGGETYGDIARRVADFLAGARRPMVIVSHGGVSRVLRAMFLGLDRKNLVELHVPQNRFMRLAAGRVEFL